MKKFNISKESKIKIIAAACAVLICVAFAVFIALSQRQDGNPSGTDSDTSNTESVDGSSSAVSDAENVSENTADSGKDTVHAEPVLQTSVDTGIIKDETENGEDNNADSTSGKIDGYTVGRGIFENYSLGNGLEIVSFGAYDGKYIEGGDDSTVTGVCAVEVANKSDDDIQYAEITVVAEIGHFNFTLTTLPAGASVLLLESEKKEFSEEAQFKYAFSDNVALFISGGLDLMSDTFIITGDDYSINITNKSGKDYNGAVTVYFKQTENGRYFGGITYGATIKQGIKSGQSVVVPTNHFKIDTCKVMFVTAVEE